MHRTRCTTRHSRSNSETILNDVPCGKVYVPNMTKLIALITAGLFAAGTMFADEHGNCTKQVGNEAKEACQVSLASLNQTPEQKTKLDADLAVHKKACCSGVRDDNNINRANDIMNYMSTP